MDVQRLAIRIDADSFSIGARLWGSFDPLSHILVAWPDWAQTAEIFDNFGKEFAKLGCCFLAVDPPGHGESDSRKAFEWYQEHDDAFVLWKVVDALHWRGRCSIIGHGQRGGAVALLAAAGWPDRTFALALLDSSLSMAGTDGGATLPGGSPPRAMWHAYHEQKSRWNGIQSRDSISVHPAQSQPVYFLEEQLQEVLRDVQCPVFLARSKHHNCTELVFEERCACIRSLRQIFYDSFDLEHFRTASATPELVENIMKWMTSIDETVTPSIPEPSKLTPPGFVPGVSPEEMEKRLKRLKDSGWDSKSFARSQPPVRVWDPCLLPNMKVLKKSGHASRQLRLPILDGTFVIAAEAWGDPASSDRILAVSGYLDNAGSWAGLAPYLAGAGWYVVAIDQPGNGLSSHYPAHAAYVEHEECVTLIHVMDALNWNSAVLMGHSRGSGIVTIAAGAFPDRIRAVVVVETFFGFYDRDIPISVALRDSVISNTRNLERQMRTFDSLRELIEHNYNNPTFPKSYEAAVAISTRHATQRLDGKWSFTHDVRSYGQKQCFRIGVKQGLAFLAAIKCPVLAINCEDRDERLTIPHIDKLFPDRPDIVRTFKEKSKDFTDLLHERQECIGNLTVLQLAGGHHLHADNPAQVWELLRPWLAQHVQAVSADAYLNNGTPTQECVGHATSKL